MPEHVRNDPVMYGECLGGALYWNDFLRIARQQGFTGTRLVADRPLDITDPRLALAVRAGSCKREQWVLLNRLASGLLRYVEPGFPMCMDRGIAGRAKSCDMLISHTL